LKRNLMHISGAGLIDSTSKPNVRATRLRDNYVQFKSSKWIILSNLSNTNGGVATNIYPEALIQFFHVAGIKCMVWAHSWDTIAKHYLSFEQMKAQVDAQLSWGTSIDAINFDEMSPWNIEVAYMEAIVDYIHSKGKLASVNATGRDVPDQYAVKPDFICVEGSWYGFSQYGGNGKTDLYTHNVNLIQTYPEKWWGISADFYTANIPSWQLPPNSKVPIDEAEAVRLTLLAWDSGIAYFQVGFGEYFEDLPDWWESYLQKISFGGENVANVTFNGSAKDESANTPLNGAAVAITVTKPDGSTETVTATTNTQGAFSTQKTYTAIGNYSAQATFTLADYNPKTSNKIAFEITKVNGNMVVTFNASVA
jgi:hypothetical protein